MNPKPNSRKLFQPLKIQSHFVTSLFLVALVSIWWAKQSPLPQTISLPTTLIAVCILASILLLQKNIKFARLLSLTLITFLAFVSASNFKLSLSGYEDLYGQTVGLTGTVQDDAAYNQYGDYEFNLSKLHFAEDGEYLQGRIRIRTKQNVAVYRGDKIYVEGKLKDTLGSRTGSISYAKIEVLESNPSTLENIRLKFFSLVYSSLPEPHASLGIGFLAGVRSSMTKEFQDQLSLVGLTHIVAVSGYNLTVLVLAIGKIGKRLGKFQRLIISLSLLAVFLLITGFAPSIVRASVVCVISLFCTFFGRKINPLNLILISAALTAGFNPTYLWEDIGWWLSFLAFFGVLILAPAITNKIYKEKEPGLISSIIIESFSAQVLTAPLIAHIFGTFSIISLIANVLVIPLIPLVMFLVFIVGAVGIITPDLSLILGTLPKIILTPIIWIIENLSEVSWASTQLKLSQSGMLLVYVFIGLFIKFSHKSSNSSISNYQPLMLRSQ
jgi:competence protein ComEC